jgi:hypothetical protein
MSKESFIDKVKDFLGVSGIGADGKKKKVKLLLEKLKERKKEIKKELDSGPTKKRKRELEEDLNITKFHIKKGLKALGK